MEQVKQLFENYVQNFDLTNPDIKRKYDHSYRVMELSNELANSIHLSKRDCELAMLIGLLHDIGRFEQLKRVHSYNDFQFEHADYGATYLQDSSFLDPLLLTEEEKLVIVSAVKYHNKYHIPLSHHLAKVQVALVTERFFHRLVHIPIVRSILPVLSYDLPVLLAVFLLSY